MCACRSFFAVSAALREVNVTNPTGYPTQSEQMYRNVYKQSKRLALYPYVSDRIEVLDKKYYCTYGEIYGAQHSTPVWAFRFCL